MSTRDATEHVLGNPDAPVTVLEYADFECPYCAAAAPVLKQLVEESDGRVRLVFRHFPLAGNHPHALTAALAAEAAGAQGAFWPMHDLLFARQDRLTDSDLRAHVMGMERSLKESRPEPEEVKKMQGILGEAMEAYMKTRGLPW